MKTLLITLLTILSLQSNGIYANDDYSTRWCKDVGLVLEAAVRSSTTTRTYEEEKELLLSAIENSIEKTPEKNNEYFLYTLNEISVGLTNYETTKDQVNYLRLQTRYALSDLRYLDRRFKCPFCEGDNGAYVVEVLERGLKEGTSTKTDMQEEFALNHAASSSIRLIDDSTFRRNYTCSKKALQETLEISNIEMKRSLIRHAINNLKNRLFCRQW